MAYAGVLTVSNRQPPSPPPPPIHKHMWCQLQKNFVFTHRRMERKALWAVVFGRTSRQQLNFVSALWHFDHTIVYSLINKQYIRGSMTNNKRMIVTGMIKLLSSVWICVYSVYFGWFSDSQYTSMCLYIINMLHMFILVLIGGKKWGNYFVWKDGVHDTKHIDNSCRKHMNQ